MEQPRVIENCESSEGGPLLLWPPQAIIERAETLLPRQSSVIDIGSSSGSTGFFLSQRGHSVRSIEMNQDYINDGLKIAQALGSSAINNTFVRGDMTNIDLGHSYDAAIATFSLHMLAHSVLHRTLGKIQTVVNPGGLNIIAGYVVTKDEEKLVNDRAFFKPNELFQIYKRASWKVLDQSQQISPHRQDAQGKYWFSSRSEMIARRPEPKVRRYQYMNANREIIHVDT